jgi:hypothetical protein
LSAQLGVRREDGRRGQSSQLLKRILLREFDRVRDFCVKRCAQWSNRFEGGNLDWKYGIKVKRRRQVFAGHCPV